MWFVIIFLVVFVLSGLLVVILLVIGWFEEIIYIVDEYGKMRLLFFILRSMVIIIELDQVVFLVIGILMFCFSFWDVLRVKW